MALNVNIIFKIGNITKHSVSSMLCRKVIPTSEALIKEIVKNMLEEFEEDPRKIWESNMFGKSLYELMNEGLHTKLEHIPDESRTKLSETLERIINEGSNGLICIIL